MCCFSSSCRPTGAVSWLASWVAFPFIPLLSVPLALVSLVQALRSGSGWAMTRSSLLSPLVLVTVFVAGKAVNDYGRGAAMLHRDPAGSRSAGWSVDPRTRLPVVRTPDRNRVRRFASRVYDRVASRLCRAFGPQAGSWTGTLPSPREAGEALAAGRPAGLEEVRQVSGAHHLVHCFALLEGKTPDHPLRHGHFRDVEVVGTGAGFFVVLDSATGRTVATYGSLPR